MNERTKLFLVGLMFLATLLITATLLILFGKLPQMAGGQYRIEVQFDYAEGLAKGTPVRKSGILIGRVSDVQLTDKDSKVIATLKIDKDRKIFQNEECIITKDLLGDSALAFVPVRGRSGAGEQIAPGTLLQGTYSDDPTGIKTALQGPINTVNETGKALADASDELKKAAQKVNRILDTNQHNIDDVLANAAETLESLRNIFGDKETQDKIAEAVRKLPDTFDDMSRTFRSADKSLSAFTQPSGPDGQTPIDRMVKSIEMAEKSLSMFTQQTEPGQPPPVEQIAAAMDNIGEITKLMRTIMSRMERGEGSLGALLNDRELYNRFCRAAKNIERVSRELQPIVDDARVFSDKISRHPGILIRDAVKPGSGLK